ncbi:MAG: hypothetical protein JXR25_07510 [Pontiellaceae bacterium]|nr:hypothetical protein [Pontiellaceae bacterium]MBN2784659.1 hypothetical protein [Pontiellaceae bacterium]
MKPKYHCILRGMLLFIAIALISGCQSFRNSVYCLGEDLTDIVVADATLSLGTDMGAHVMATELLQVKAYSYEDLYRLGVGPRQIGLWKAEREGWNVSLVHSRNMRVNQKGLLTFAPIESFSGKAASRNGYKALSMETGDEFGIGAHLFVVGGRIGFRPLEVVDLFANLLTLDPLNDNMDWWQRQAIRAAKKNAKKPKTQSGESAEAVGMNPEEMQNQVIDMQRQVEDMQRQMESMMRSVDTLSLPE